MMAKESLTPRTSLPQAEVTQALRDLVPCAFVDGELSADALLTALGLSPDVEGERQPYSFRWRGIDRARAEATVGTSATLLPLPDESRNWEETANALIRADN